MGMQVTNGAALQCSFGVAPSVLTVLPAGMTMAGGNPAATIMDHVPMLNIAPFGMCTTLTNPTVAAATAAALGVLTPMPCVPVTSTPWLPGSATVMIGNKPALNSDSMCTCNWGGVIKINFPGCVTVQIP